MAAIDNIGYPPNDESSVWVCSLSMNIIYDTIKLQNTEIDAIIDGTAVYCDDETGTDENTDRGITQSEIDNVLNL